jgi:hypothetical protein
MNISATEGIVVRTGAAFTSCDTDSANPAGAGTTGTTCDDLSRAVCVATGPARSRWRL